MWKSFILRIHRWYRPGTKTYMNVHINIRIIGPKSFWHNRQEAIQLNISMACRLQRINTIQAIGRIPDLV